MPRKETFLIQCHDSFNSKEDRYSEFKVKVLRTVVEFLQSGEDVNVLPDVSPLNC